MLQISPIGFIILVLILLTYLFVKKKRITPSPKSLIIAINSISFIFAWAIIYTPQFTGELINIYIEQLYAIILWFFTFGMLVLLNVVFIFLHKKRLNNAAFIIFMLYLVLLLHGIFSIFSSSLL